MMGTQNNKKYTIFKISHIEEVFKYSGKIFLFDIEQTILRENRFVPKYKNAMQTNYFVNLLQMLCKKCNIHNYEQLLMYGKHFKRELLESNVVNVINKLRYDGYKVYALTSGYPNIDKFVKMQKEHGVVFDHVICTSRGAKGPALLQHVLRFNITEDCVFIDNHESKLRSVGETFMHANKTNQIKLLHYTYLDRYSPPSRNDFIKYWIQVIESFRIQSNDIYFDN